jgi:hypothetical protein
MKERYQAVYDLRQAGKTFREIGTAMGCSPSGAQCIYRKACDTRWEEENDPFGAALSTLTKNALREYRDCRKSLLKGRALDPQKIANTGCKKLSTIDQIGPKGIRELAEALERFGFIESAAEWMEKGR